MKRAAIYVRLSKEDVIDRESESESIRNQKAMLINYAAKQDWEVYDVYCDEDYSGAYSGHENIRPAFRKMIGDAQCGKFDIVLCKSQSRFSRNMEVIEKYIHGCFIEWGIRFVSLIDNADTDNKGNKKARQINSLINEWYLEDLSDNVRAVFRNKMERGEYIGAFAPYGYRKDPADRHHLLIHEKTAAVVKMIFDLYGSGIGTSRICRMLNDRNIPNPRKQQETDGLRKKFIYHKEETGEWMPQTVSDILRNRVYCGDIVQHKVEKISYKSKARRNVPEAQQIVCRDMHDAIIQRPQFALVQQKLRGKRHNTGMGRTNGLCGIVYCASCGRPMQKNRSVSPDGAVREYFRCRGKYAYSFRKCPTPNIRSDIITEALYGKNDESVQCPDMHRLAALVAERIEISEIPGDARGVRIRIYRREIY